MSAENIILRTLAAQDALVGERSPKERTRIAAALARECAEQAELMKGIDARALRAALRTIQAAFEGAGK